MSVPEVQVENRSGFEIDIKRTAGMAAALLVRLGYTGGELGVTFVSSGEMEELNLQYMGRMGSTDVLSFPLDAAAMEVEAGYLAEIEAEEQVLMTNMMTGASSDEVPLLLGDVVICPEVAGVQAGAQGNTAEQELCILLIHGVLHIVGYDHETDGGEMEKMQGQLFEEMCSG